MMDRYRYINAGIGTDVDLGVIVSVLLYLGNRVLDESLSP